jgi:phosphodiesterase/alkaline phosphatase D-like protein
MKIAFSSCNHPYVHPQQPGWLAVAAQAPDVLLLLGDNVYIEDTPQEVAVKALWPSRRLSDIDYARRLHARYRMQAHVPQFRQALQASGQVMGTLDDHDFLGNDQYVTDSTQAKARIARQLHRQFIAHCNTKPLPLAYPELQDALSQPDAGFDEGLGIASVLEQGAVKIMLLDNRSYRQSPKISKSVALGAAQIDWLARQLGGPQLVSMVASGSTISPGDVPAIRGNPLADYPLEAHLMRHLYRSQQHQTVLHLGGDLHYNALWPQQQASLGYPGFTELVSSGMGSGWQPFAKRCLENFGVISITDDAVQVQLLGKQAWRNRSLQIPRVS